MSEKRTLSERFFQLLLRVFPFDFQREYGREMEEVFREQRQEILRKGGVMGTMKLWSRTIRGVLQTAPREHFDGLRSDVVFALRTLLLKPGFTIVAILTLALAIGANTAIFTIVNGVMLRPFPYPDIDRIVVVNEYHKPTGDTVSTAYPNFEDWRRQNTVFEHLGIYRRMDLNLTGLDQAQRVSGAMASASLFSVAGLQPLMGRVFTIEEDKAGTSPVAIISERLWQTRFGSEPGTLGRTIVLNGVVHTIVGIMPAGMRIPARATDVWLPLGLYVAGFPKGRGVHPNLWAMGKLKPGITLRAASAEMTGVADRLSESYPDSNKNSGVQVVSFYEQAVGGVRQPLYTLLATVGFVLLIGCANLGNLMLVRADARQREMAVRASLGASKWRIVRQLLTESVLLSLAGGGAGVLLARWGIDVLVSSNPVVLPRLDQIRMDPNVLLFALAVSLGSAILFGLVPAVRLSRFDLQTVIRESGHGSGGGRRGRLRGALVVSEVALAVIVLIGAGLTIRSFQQVMRIEPGFNTANIVTANISLPSARYTSPEAWTAFYGQLIQRMKAVPGVESISVSSGLPLSGGAAESGILPEGQPFPKPGDHGFGCAFFTVSSEYFKTMGITLLSGRTFSDQDSSDAPMVAVVDEKLAKTFWPSEDPIGKRVAFEVEGQPPDLKPTWRQVVGVVRSVKHYSLEAESPRLQIYTPYSQIPLYYRQSRPVMNLMVYTAASAETMVSQIRQEVSAMDKDLPVFGVSTMQEIFDSQLEGRRLPLWLMTLFSTLALALAIVGIYGVMSYSVSQRTHEIGVRIALGAQHRDVLGMVVTRAIVLVGSGIAIGTVAGLALTRTMKNMLFQTSPNDPVTLVCVAGILAAVALAASYIPARRATRVDPLIALRYD